MIAASPRNMMAVTSPDAPAALTPSPAPRITIAVLMNHSGRAACLSHAATPGRTLPTTSPASKATMYPASPVRPSDHAMPMAARLSGVCGDVGVMSDQPAQDADPEDDRERPAGTPAGRTAGPTRPRPTSARMNEIRERAG